MAKLTAKVKTRSSKKALKGASIDIDGEGLALGRLATQVAKSLLGKDVASFAPNKIREITVRVYNADKIKLTGKKSSQKIYRRYSGYPGGLKEKKLEELMKKDSRRVIWQAVWGMLPKNKLRKHRIKNLELYKDSVSK